MTDDTPFYQADGLNVETFDELTAQDFAPGDKDVAFYLRQARRFGGPVLDLGAGTGRVAWPLAEAGFDVVGLDLSEAMLRRAAAKGDRHAPDVRERVRFLPGNMADFDLEQQFALVIIAFRSFQALLSPEDQRRCLNCIHRHLKPGGRLILDLFDPRLDLCVPDAKNPCDKPTVCHPVSGNKVEIEFTRLRTDPLQQLLVERWRFQEIDDAGKVIREDIDHLALRWTYRHEMRYLLELTGFQIEAEYSDYDESPPAYGREQLWVVRKP
ncbi:MAG TPA: class I SAM-dependent methyltransferase [Phycisphaerae bacterium]|nr:class I SAM-dependent methyltransferase [Phycisphaerae bacterium]